ncbi:MAG: hypothetical protein ABI388_07890 [Bacteroidia bacterium]
MLNEDEWGLENKILAEKTKIGDWKKKQNLVKTLLNKDSKPA